MWIRGHTVEFTFHPGRESLFLFMRSEPDSYRPSWTLRLWPVVLHYAGPIRPGKRRSQR